MSFLRILPQNISLSSPWYAYLTAVYGEPPQLPFNMQDITFVHHNTQAWSQKHPALFWPMPPCLRRSKGGMDAVVEAGWPDCPEDSCRMWYADSRDGGPAAPRGRRDTFLRGNVRPHWYSLLTGETLGVGWTYVSKSYWIPPSPAGTWREVARYAYGNEGRAGYGYWFSYATGSGMWINVGRTAVVPVKDDRAAVDGMFYPAWCRLHNRSCANRSRQLFRDVLVRGIRVEKPGYIPPFVAYDLGYDTVQFQRGVSSTPELVATGSAAMVRPGCAVDAPRTAHNHMALMARYCPPGPSGCAGGIELRTGSRAEHPCVCDEAQPALNCNLTA